MMPSLYLYGANPVKTENKNTAEPSFKTALKIKQKIFLKEGWVLVRTSFV